MRHWSTLSLLISGLVLGLMIWIGLKLEDQHTVVGQNQALLSFAIVTAVGAFFLVSFFLLLRTIRWLFAHRIVQVVFGAALVVFGGYMLNFNHRLDLEGQKTSADVVHRLDKTIHQFVDFIPVGSRHEYYLDYTYEVAGKSYSRTGDWVSTETWDATASNTKIPIKYLPGDPGSSETIFPMR